MNGLPFLNEAVLSIRSFLSAEQRDRLFAIPVEHAEMARHYVLASEAVSKRLRHDGRCG